MHIFIWTFSVRICPEAFFSWHSPNDALKKFAPTISFTPEFLIWAVQSLTLDTCIVANLDFCQKSTPLKTRSIIDIHIFHVGYHLNTNKDVKRCAVKFCRISTSFMIVHEQNIIPLYCLNNGYTNVDIPNLLNAVFICIQKIPYVYHM